MGSPDEIDSLLRSILSEKKGKTCLAAGDRKYLDTMIKDIENGSQGVFVVLHKDERVQYMLLNANGFNALELLTSALQWAKKRFSGWRELSS